MKANLLKILPILIIASSVLFIGGCGKKEINSENNYDDVDTAKKVLYNIKIENLDYINQSILNYNYEDEYKKIFLQIDDTLNNCSFYYKDTDGINGIYWTANNDNCKFSVKEGILTLDLYAKVIISNVSSYEQNIKLNGEFDITGKNLKININNKTYEILESTYVKLLETGHDEALVDPNTHTIYSLDGESIWGSGFDNEKEQLDLSEYDIQDMTISYENLWSTE